MFLCVIMAVSIIQIPEKVVGETTESSILYRYMDAKTEKYGYVNRNGKPTLLDKLFFEQNFSLFFSLKLSSLPRFGSDTLFNLNFYTCFFICSICRNCSNYYCFSLSCFLCNNLTFFIHRCIFCTGNFPFQCCVC